MKTSFPNIRAIADSKAPQRLHAAAKPTAPKPRTLSVRDICVASGVPEQPNGRIPLAAVDKFMKLRGWDFEKRMLWKNEARRVGLID